MRSAPILMIAFFLCPLLIRAQLIQEDFSSGSINTSTWGFYDTPENTVGVSNENIGERGVDHALVYAQTENNDFYEDWGFYSLESWPRSDGDGFPLSVTLDMYATKHSIQYVGWVADTGGAYDWNEMKYNLHPSGDNLYVLEWEGWRDGGIYGATWAPGIDVGGTTDKWIPVRVTLNDPTGCMYEYHDGNDWVELRNVDTGDPSTDFHFGMMFSPRGDGEIAAFDNIKIEYIGADVPNDVEHWMLY